MTATHLHRRSALALGLTALLSMLLLTLSTRPTAAAPMVGEQPSPSARAAAMEQDYLMAMIPHDRGTIMIAQMALERSQQPRLRRSAERIINEQNRAIVRMTTYLRDWYGLEPPAGMMMPPEMMARMGMSPMDGETMNARMQSLMTLSGARFDIAYLTAMIDHDAMALMMAGSVLMNAYHSEIYSLATQSAQSQAHAIAAMRRWLADWYGVEHPA